jgi:signal transduction histidine kinase
MSDALRSPLFGSAGLPPPGLSTPPPSPDACGSLPHAAESHRDPPGHEAFFLAAPLPQWLLDADLTIVQHNALAARLLTRLRPGHRLVDALPLPADALRLEALCQRPPHRAPVPVCDVLLRDGADGAARRGDLHFSALRGPDGLWLGVTFVDRTRDLDREAAQDLALSRAVEASAAKTLYLAGLGHELRTPLNAVVGMAQLIVGRPPHAAEAAGRDTELARVILDAGRHMDQVLSACLDLQSAELGRLQVRPEVVDLGSVLAQAVGLTAYRYQGRGVSLRTAPVPRDTWVRADATRCRQVAINLLDNAAKYTPAGRGVSLAVCRDGDGWRVDVRDEGPGLTEAQQRELFLPFRRLGAEHTPTPGLGMGLAVSRQLIDRMNGRIGCASAVGQGSRFWFWLPGADAPAGPPPH